MRLFVLAVIGFAMGTVKQNHLLFEKDFSQLANSPGWLQFG
jgi:hypothetical protein